jgi:site-specific DNA recombinase
MPKIPRDPGPPRVVLYLRVSTPGQEEGASLSTQEAAGQAYAAQHGYQIVATFTEVHTGSELYERRELSALREMVRAGQVDVLLSYALDRLSRSQPHIYVVAEECERHGARLEFVTEDFEDSAVGRFIRSAKAFAAEVEREKIIERTMRGSRARVQAGRMIPGWKPPYGYAWTEDHTGLVLNPLEAPIVERIYREALAGKTLRAIALGLTADGIPTPTGRQGWTHPTVRWFLWQPVYTGQPRAFRQKIVREKGKKSMVTRPEEEQIVLPPCPAIVGPAEFAAVGLQLAKNQAQAYRNNHNPEAALLRGGYVRCGYCGCAMIVRSQVSRPTKHKPIYHCGAGPTRRVEPCPGLPSIRVEDLDGRVWAKLSAYLSQPDALPSEFARQAQQGPRIPTPDALERQLLELRRQQENLVNNLAFVEGEAAVLISRKLAQLGERQQQLRLEHVQQQDELERWQEVQQRTASLRDWCAATAQHLDSLDFTERRAVLDWLGVRVYVWRTSDQAPEMTAELPSPPTARAERWSLVERRGTPPPHNDGIVLRWRLE